MGTGESCQNVLGITWTLIRLNYGEVTPDSIWAAVTIARNGTDLTDAQAQEIYRAIARREGGNTSQQCTARGE